MFVGASVGFLRQVEEGCERHDKERATAEEEEVASRNKKTSFFIPRADYSPSLSEVGAI